jgi:hypothetical protein
MTGRFLLLLVVDDDSTDVATDVCARGELTAVGLEAPRAASCNSSSSSSIINTELLCLYSLSM